MKWLAAGGLSLIAVIAVVGGILAVQRGEDETATSSSGDSPADQASSGGIDTGALISHEPNAGAAHVPVGADHAPYPSSPATSGPHWFTEPVPDPGSPVAYGAPAPWGIYEEPLPDEVLVHNLEHGGIGLHYNCPKGCPELVEQLQSIIPENPSQFILSPYPDMPTKIAVTAWRWLLTLEAFDRAEIEDFIAQHKDNAPESVPNNLWERPG